MASRRQYSGDSLAPVKGESLGAVVRKVMEFGRSKADPMAPAEVVAPSEEAARVAGYANRNAAAPVVVSTPPQPIVPYSPKGITAEGAKAGMKVDGQMGGVRSGSSGSAGEQGYQPGREAVLNGQSLAQLQAKYPGLQGFSMDEPFDTAKTLASLKANERPYLQTAEREVKPFKIETLKSREAGGPGGIMISGGGQTREDSARESALMAGQIQTARADQERLDKARAQDEAVRQAAIAQRMAADKAAQEAEFLERYGIPYSKEAAEVMAKFKGEGDAAEKLMTLVFDAQQQEAEERAQINPADKAALDKHKALWERKVKDYLLAAGIGSKAPSQAGLREDAQGAGTMQGMFAPQG